MAFWCLRYVTSLEKLPHSLAAQDMRGLTKHGVLAGKARPFVVDWGNDPLAVDIRRKFEVELRYYREAALTGIELFLDGIAL